MVQKIGESKVVALSGSEHRLSYKGIDPIDRIRKGD